MVKLRDVAEAAGVSVTTASMVLNPGKQICRVRPECAEKIKLVAQRLGYVGNYHARAMQLGRAETIGLALDAGQVGLDNQGPASVIGGPYFSQLAGGVESYTHYTGYNLTIIGPGKTERAPDRGVRQLLQRRLDGLVVSGVLTSINSSRLLQEEPLLPVVLAEYESPTQIPVVTYGEQEGVALGVSHLAELGHRELLWLGPDNPGPARREQMFIRGVWDRGLRGSSCRFSVGVDKPDTNPVADAAQAALTQKLKEPRTFTGLVCYNDATAIGAYGALMNAGLRIPADVSVVGFDDFSASSVFPRLTTVSHVLAEMGRKAAELVYEMAADPKAMERLRGHREVIIPRLIKRDSSGPAKS